MRTLHASCVPGTLAFPVETLCTKLGTCANPKHQTNKQTPFFLKKNSVNFISCQRHDLKCEVLNMETSFQFHIKILQIRIFMLTRLPGSRDRRVGSNKILDLSRNCPSQPTQFLLYPPGGRNPTSWNALPEM